MPNRPPRSHTPRSLCLAFLSFLWSLGALGSDLAAQTGATYGGPQVAGNFIRGSSITASGRMGTALAVGDFDGDGDQDLAVGAPGDSPGGIDAGRVDLFLSFPGGILVLVARYNGNAGSALGSALAAGDFDNDGIDEIAVGITEEVIFAVSGAGRVAILHFVSVNEGLEEVASLHQEMALVPEASEQFDFFGSELAVGDFNDDGYDDLAVGVPYEDVGASGNDQGLVNVFYGFANGLSDFGSQTFTQDSTQMLGQTASGDLFGTALAAGDFDADGYDDLAIGIIGETAGAIANAGGVAVLYGRQNSGLSTSGNQLWTEESPGITGNAGASDDFGGDLAAGDFDGDGYADLAIGTPGDNPLGLAGAGAIHTLYGAASGLVSSGSQYLYATNVTPHASVAGSHFGARLVAGAFDGGPFADLAISSPYAAVAGIAQAGLVDSLLGSANGLSSLGARRFQATGLASGPPETDDVFGWSLAAGNYDGDAADELFIGVPGRLHTAVNFRVGLVQVLLGEPRIFGHDFDTGLTLGWSSIVP